MNYEERAERFIAALRRVREDRGRMADLRCGLKDTTQTRAFATLAGCGGRVDSVIDLTVAALYALHPKESADRNLGTTWRRLRFAAYGASDERNSLDVRFSRLLACRTAEQLCKHLLPFVTFAKSHEAGINYVALHTDLSRWDWSDRARLDWAREYWQAREDEGEPTTPAETQSAT